MKISLVVPVLNEEDTIPLFYKEVRSKLENWETEIIFVNDGSSDATEKIVSALSLSDPLVKLLSFTRNFGKEPGLC